MTHFKNVATELELLKLNFIGKCRLRREMFEGKKTTTTTTKPQ